MRSAALGKGGVKTADTKLRAARKQDNIYIRSQIEAGEHKRQQEFARELNYRQSLSASRAEQNAKWIGDFENRLGCPFNS
ncbi:hypothetical protein [Flexibacterium corallicola]|uniref:hypothetical protein n=1 Tax=Flexibacterium corallicola TaxID=3037259 RepID=UPI00286F7396|nr:hypothetical protein [Pseudovibrio sp. M1P-2-3]